MSHIYGAFIMAGLFIVAGSLSILGAIFNWDWFYNSINSRMITGNFKRRTARWFYFVVGILSYAMATMTIVDLFDKY